MKPKAANTIKLKFMDCVVEMRDNKKNLDRRALGLMSYLIQDRLKLQELMSELDHGEDEPGRKNKKKNIQPNIEFEMVMYA